jgi:hypothetical protein
MSPHQITHEYLRAERMALAHPVGDRMIVLNRPAADAFDDLSEALVTRSSGMERGVPVFEASLNAGAVVIVSAFALIVRSPIFGFFA